MRFGSLMVYFCVLLGGVALAPVAGAEGATYTLEIKDHTFSPATLTIPADTPWTLIIKNHDKTPEEFESETLSREKIIPGGGQVRVKMAALKPGTYPFIGEFNPDKAKGQVIVK